jgi:hypothetical protein
MGEYELAWPLQSKELSDRKLCQVSKTPRKQTLLHTFPTGTALPQEQTD